MGDPADARRAEANHAAIALFAAIVALAVAGIGFLSRWGFSDNSPLEWAKYVGLSWFLISFSGLSRRMLAATGRGGFEAWWTSPAGLSLAALALVAVWGIAWDGAIGSLGSRLEANASHSPAAVVFALVGALGFLLAVIRVVRTQRCRDVVVLAALAGFFSLYAAGACWGSGYSNPLFVEGLCSGIGQIDTLYHATLANMLRSYGIASTGLDGLTFAPYHFGSHWLFAGLCNLLDVRVIDFYNRGYAVVFVPFGVFSLATVAATFGERRLSKSDEPRVASIPDRPIGPLFWFGLCAGSIGLMPYAAGLLPEAGWNVNIVSESYGLAVTVSLLAIAVAWQFFEALRARPRARSVDVAAGIVLLAALLGLIGLFKISHMLILAAAGLYLIVRLGLYRRASVAALLVCAAVSIAWALRLTANPGYAQVSPFVPFGFLRWNVAPQWWFYYWAIFYVWVWAFAAVRLSEEHVRTLGDLATAFAQRTLLDVEFLLAVAVVGGVPDLLTTYSGSHFFAEYQHWPAVALLLSILVRRPQTGSARQAALGRLTLRRIAAAAILLCVGGTLAANVLGLLGRMVTTNLAARGHAAGQTGLGVALMHGQLKAAAEILRQTAAGVEARMKTDKHIVADLGGLDALPLAEKRRSLLFIPKSNRQYWELLHGPYWPQDGPFVGPALSGVAMIDGLYVPAQDDPWIGFGYHQYSKAAASKAQPPLSQYLPVLRRRCAQMGFSQLIVIDADRNQMPTLRKYDCR